MRSRVEYNYVSESSPSFFLFQITHSSLYSCSIMRNCSLKFTVWKIKKQLKTFWKILKPNVLFEPSYWFYHWNITSQTCDNSFCLSFIFHSFFIWFWFWEFWGVWFSHWCHRRRIRILKLKIFLLHLNWSKNEVPLQLISISMFADLISQ